MSSRSHWRGHPIIYDGGRWLYADTGLPVQLHPDRPCGHCGAPNTPEGHDACLGTIPGALNACCGHGSTAEAYIQYCDRLISGEEVTAIATTERPHE